MGGAFGPHYSLAEVLHFRGNFNSVDVDMSGTLDMNEWMKFLHRMNQKMSPTDAQLLFMHIDHDRSGTIEMSELLPVVFSNAKPEQHKLMHRLILSENAKRVRREIDNVTRADVVSLFGLYSDAKGQMAINKLDQCLTSLGFNAQSLELATLEVENQGLTLVDMEMFLELCEKFIDVDP